MKSRFNQQKLKENLAGYLFILPNFLGVFLFVVFPLLFSLVMVFIDWDYMMGFSGIEWVGLAHFKKLMTDEYFLQSLKNNFIFTAVTVPSAMAIGLVIAVILNKFVYLKNFLRVLFFLPYVSSIVAISIVWSVMYNPTNGPINGTLRSLGIENLPGWLASPDWALPAIIIMVVWTYTGYTMVLYMAGLQGVPKDLYEAASIDGATGMKSFFKITVPMLKPTSFLIAVTLIISTFQVFAAVAVMTKGGPLNSTMVLAYYIYIQAFQYYEMGYAAAMSWVLFLIIFVITILQWREQKKWQDQF
ncbi:MULTISPECIES: carbohydrate ABC transporter permease [Paenibacillus]|uniref:carbohydrate ABC transporter permease n=1 Tax=Paenibacillus TaxID=44249 RepID=UPI0006D021A9|nr:MULTISPECIES: sugar ABC transporter permease [Paenibacillus]NTZ19164.1 sugar ABC transporter permease [Paenibacillus sp. JMULE4]GCL74109.1 sugar ABC transporter permease [Paenibacillus naphthalenovorans]SDJ34864.1 multiple sugar transport system permease protein [Paenibacillus naphthalenovorans]